MEELVKRNNEYNIDSMHQITKININSGKRYVFKTHINEILLPRENAEIIEAFLVIIEPGKYTHLHKHDDTEQLYFIISGEGQAELESADSKFKHQLCPGDIIYIPRKVSHQIFCLSTDEPLRYLCIDGFSLGKPQNEPTWESHFKEVVEMQKRTK
jgi:mannose-6-phosphate isomerase-like protein (cupin superfamily)